MGTAACELWRSERNHTFALPSSSSSVTFNARIVANRGERSDETRNTGYPSRGVCDLPAGDQWL